MAKQYRQLRKTSEDMARAQLAALAREEPDEDEDEDLNDSLHYDEV